MAKGEQKATREKKKPKKKAEATGAKQEILLQAELQEVVVRRARIPAQVAL